MGKGDWRRPSAASLTLRCTSVQHFFAVNADTCECGKYTRDGQPVERPPNGYEGHN